MNHNKCKTKYWYRIILGVNVIKQFKSKFFHLI